jgi:hypothetical protein
VIEKCAGETYVSAGRDEDGALLFLAECNGGPLGDCGWEVNLDAHWGGGFTDAEFQQICAEHRAHRSNRKDAA